MKALKIILIIGMFFLLLNGAFAALDTQNLTAWYKFDETSGTVAIDSKGYDQNGSNSNISVNNVGKIGQGYVTQTTNAAVTLPAGTLPLGGAVWTITGWIKTTAAEPYMAWNGNNGTRDGFALFAFSHHLRCGATGISPDSTITTIDIDDNAWHFFACTYSTNSMIAYLDGEKGNDAAVGTNNIANSNHYLLNNLNLNATAGPLYDEISIWTVKLSNADINLLYNSGTGVTYCPDLNAFYTNCGIITPKKIDFNVYRLGTTSHLTDINMDCNVNSLDLTGQTSPFSSTYDINKTVSCQFIRVGYDTNTQVIVYDSNKTLVIYLKDSNAPVVGQTTITGFTTYGFFINKDGNINATASDLGSDINSLGCWYTDNNGSTWAQADHNATHCYKNGLSITDKNYIFNFKAYANDGNVGTGTATISYVGDTNKPVTTFVSVQVPNTLDQNITFTCVDLKSGCKKMYYNIDSNVWIERSFGTGGGIFPSGNTSYWKFDEAAGLVANDANTITALNGANGGGITVNQPGKINTSYGSFSTTKYVDLGTAPAKLPLTHTKAVTYCAWIYPIANQLNNTFIYDLGGSGGRFTYQIWFRGDGKLTNEPGNSGLAGYGADSDGNIPNGVWTHFCGTFTGTNEANGIKIYINGALQTDTGTFGSAPGAADLTATIGNNRNRNVGFNGYIDEFGVWDRNLSQSEIATLYNSGAGLDYNNNSITSINPFSFLYPGVGPHTIQYYSIDNVDNTEVTQNGAFTTYGLLRIKVIDENTGFYLNGVTLNFNGINYDINSTRDINLAGVTADANILTFSKAGYGTRTYSLVFSSVLQYDVNIMLLGTTRGSDISFTFYANDAITPIANGYAELYRPDRNNFSIGRIPTNQYGRATFFLNNFDQNYVEKMTSASGDINYSYPVRLLVLFPLDEMTGLPIAYKWQLASRSIEFVTYPDINIGLDKNIYLLSNTTAPYSLEIQDMNNIYFMRVYAQQFVGNPLTASLQPFLISNLDGANITFITTNQLGFAIPGITIAVSKIINNTKTLISSGVTDSSGEYATNLGITAPYLFDLSVNGIQISPSSFNLQIIESKYYFTINTFSYPIDANSSYPITVLWNPSTEYVYTAASLTQKIAGLNVNFVKVIIYQFTDSNNTGRVDRNIYYFNCPRSCIINQILADVNGLDRNYPFYVDVNVYADANLIYERFTKLYRLPTVGGVNLMQLFVNAKRSFGCSPTPESICPWTIIATLLIAIIAMGAVMYALKIFNPFAMAIVGSIVVVFFTIAGWFFWPLLIPLALVLVFGLFGRRGSE